MEAEALYHKFQECGVVTTDTRQITPGAMFFALKGANFNGNQFAKDALEKGARYAVIDEVQYKEDDRYIVVEDALAALQQLANYHRRQMNIPFIAVTGSNGKTTTKELINAVLSKKFRSYATRGNLNNHIGIPLTLLSITREHEIAIIEMGANHQKEIEGYCQITEPTHGMITNVGKAHLEGFGGVEGVKKGKGELYDYLKKTGGVAFINAEDDTLMEMSKFEKPVLYLNEGWPKVIEVSPFVKFQTKSGIEKTTHLTGKYNFNNIAAALAIGAYFGVSEKDACDAVAEYNPQNNRSQIVEKGSNKILLDAYNANPSSMKAAIENFAQLKADHKVLILGDMFELGPESEAEHKQLGKLIKNLGFEKVILCGKEMQYARKELEEAAYFPDKTALLEWLKQAKLQNKYFLIKGSRGMGLEVCVEVL